MNTYFHLTFLQRFNVRYIQYNAFEKKDEREKHIKAMVMGFTRLFLLSILTVYQDFVPNLDV